MSIPHRTSLPPVRTPEQLADRWRLLAADEEVVPRTDLWVQLFDADGHQQASLVIVEDVPERPAGPFAANLAGVLAELLAEQTSGVGSVAFALSPPGPRPVGASDLEWAQALVGACAAGGVGVLGVHVVAGPRVERVL
ncbi:hypothetical protein [Kineococcus sp. SYSU DK002]|uniref:hypothetical protein n=1 Tax=Kineococcus sp. SYSU DK002 TaxID=3383123 RepID=UPI003D7D3A8B